MSAMCLVSTSAHFFVLTVSCTDFNFQTIFPCFLFLKKIFSGVWGGREG